MQQFLQSNQKEYQQKLVKSAAAWPEWQSTFFEFNLLLLITILYDHVCSFRDITTAELFQLELMTHFIWCCTTECDSYSINKLS
jgi:hypothetical protein